MVISVTPNERDEFNDLSTLKIRHAKGIIETPNRLVNRYDLNAKDQIGADIPLTRTSKSFIVQENINPEKLNFVLTKNGYLGEILGKIRPILSRIDSESLVFLYPSMTPETANLLDTPKKFNDFTRFFCDLAINLGLESLVMPIIKNVNDVQNITTKKGLQLVPVLNLRADTPILNKQFFDCRNAGSENIPIITLKFSTYPMANKGFDLVMDNFETLHEDNQAIMMVDSPRMLGSAESLNVSGPHYGSFFTADLIAERYTGVGGVSDDRRVRLFCKNDLVTPYVEKSATKFDLDGEKTVFANDKKLQELLERVAKNRTTSDDWKNNRPRYLSRAHENVRTRLEFQSLHENIKSNSVSDYLSEKNDMNAVVTNHLKGRTGKQTRLF